MGIDQLKEQLASATRELAEARAKVAALKAAIQAVRPRKKKRKTFSLFG